MSKLEDNVNEILGIDKDSSTRVRIADFQEPAPVPRKIDENKPHVDQDYENSRENYYNLIDKGNEAIDGILELAKEGEHPRAYEVAGQLIKTVSEVSQNLLDLQDKLKKVKEIPEKGPKNVTNALFVGSTTELQKMLKEKK